MAPHGFSNHGDLVSGGTAANLSAVSYLPRNAASNASGREFFWAFLVAGFGATEVRTSATTPFLTGPDTFRQATRCGGSRHQGAWRVSSPPRGCHLSDLGPTCPDRGISVLLTWNSSPHGTPSSFCLVTLLKTSLSCTVLQGQLDSGTRQVCRVETTEPMKPTDKTQRGFQEDDHGRRTGHALSRCPTRLQRRPRLSTCPSVVARCWDTLVVLLGRNEVDGQSRSTLRKHDLPPPSATPQHNRSDWPRQKNSVRPCLPASLLSARHKTPDGSKALDNPVVGTSRH